MINAEKVVTKVNRLLRQLSGDAYDTALRMLYLTHRPRPLTNTARQQALRLRTGQNRNADRNAPVTRSVTPDRNASVTADRNADRNAPVTRSVTATPPYPPGFTSFWSFYPKQKRVGKAKAYESWKRQKLEQQAHGVLAGLERNIAYLLRDNGKYIPNPATWLNQGRWEDEVEAPKSTAQRLWDEAQQEQIMSKTDAMLDQNPAGS